MATNNDPPLGAGQEVIIRDEFLDNTNQQLNRHRYVYPFPTSDSDYEITDFILKRGDYTNTFIAINTEGLPDGATLYLVDENLNQLYSPVDTNGNWVTTRCSITVGENDIIPLPAQFTSNLSSHIPFPAGTYSWKLQYPENDYYLSEEIPLQVEIRDFKVWDILTPQIYPNEDVKIKLKTYGDTLYPILTGNVHDLAYVLTSNATFDVDTGIITYPNSDLNDLTLGKHMQIINQANECAIDYEVKNPLFLLTPKGTRNYTQNNINIGCGIYRDCSMQYYSQFDDWRAIVNGNIVKNRAEWKDGLNQKGNRYNSGIDFPPGQYNISIEAKLNNGVTYTCSDILTVSTENCSITLEMNYSDTALKNVRVYSPTILSNQTISQVGNTYYQVQNAILYTTGGDVFLDIESFNEDTLLIQALSSNLNPRLIIKNKNNNTYTEYSLEASNNIFINKNNNIANIIINNNTINVDLNTQCIGFITDDDNISLKVLKGEKTSSTLQATYLYNNETPIANATVYIKDLNNENIIYTNTTDANGQIQLDWSESRYQAIVQDNYTNEDLLFSNIVDTENPYLNNITLSNTGDLITTYGFNTPVDDITIDNHGDLILTLDGEVNNIINNVYIGENGELYYRSE